MLARFGPSLSRGISSAFTAPATSASRLLKVGPVSSAATTSSTALLSSATPTVAVPARSFFQASRPARSLDDFFTNQQAKHVGRSWECRELANKSFEDLRQLWFVLLKEKNMLLTYRNLCRQTTTQMKNPRRMSLVRKSMANIKSVLHQRNHEHKMASTFYKAFPCLSIFAYIHAHIVV